MALNGQLRQQQRLGQPQRFGWRHQLRNRLQCLQQPYYADTKGVPLVQGLVGGQPVRLLVDTGAPMCNLDAELAREAKGEVVERTLSIGTWSGMVRWRVKDLAVTRQAMGSTATLGNYFFNRHVVDFRVLEQTLLLR